MMLVSQSGSTESRARIAFKETAVIALVLALACWMVWPDLFNGWDSGDDGGLAQSADRLLAGQLPHRDFDDPWTGGWTFFQAAVFRLHGTTLAMLRIPIFVAWLIGLLLAFRVSRRFIAVPLAALATVACATWSLYAWHLPLLNWYYAPFALLSGWAICRFEESGHHRWLVLAGAGAGLALLVKVTGLYVLAALLLWCLVRSGDSEAEGFRRAQRGLFPALAALLLAAFLGCVVLLLRALPPEMIGAARVHFLLPSAGLSLWAFARSIRGGRTVGAGVMDLGFLVVPLLVGVLFAIAPLLWYYAQAHALRDLYAGVFVRPRVRLLLVALGPPGRLATFGALVPPVLLFVLSRYAAWRNTRREIIAAAVLGACWGLAAKLSVASAGESVALSVRATPLVLPFLALWWDRRGEIAVSQGRLAFLLVGLATTGLLVQVPFAGISYFLYVAPLGIVATLAILTSAAGAARGVLVFWLVFLLVAGASRALTAPLLGESEGGATLPFSRGGLRVSVLDSSRLARVASIIAMQPPGPLHVIGNAPEVPFLLERANHGRAVYDILSDSAGQDPVTMIAALRRDGVQTVLIHHDRRSSSALVCGQVLALRREFPAFKAAWPYEVRFRPAATRAQAIDSVMAHWPCSGDFTW